MRVKFLFSEIIDAYKEVFSFKPKTIEKKLGIPSNSISPLIKDAIDIFNIPDFTKMVDRIDYSVKLVDGTDCGFALAAIPNDVYGEVFGARSSTFEFINANKKFIIVQIVPNLIGGEYYSEKNYIDGIWIVMDQVSKHTHIKDYDFIHYTMFTLIGRHLIEQYEATMEEDLELFEYLADNCYIKTSDVDRRCDRDSCIKFLFNHFDDSDYTSMYKSVNIMRDPLYYDLKGIVAND